MSADKFAMNPESTLNGLMRAGQERTHALAAGLPAMPAGNYTAAYAAQVEATLVAHHAVLSEQAVAGMTTAAASVTATEANESAAAAELST